MVFPRWTYAYVALTVFMYQTFDAIDGKQARRTKTSSPLGQLFDHGCDAINTILALYCYNHAMHFDIDLGYFILNLSGTVSEFCFLTYYCFQVTFYLTQWEEFHTHTMRTNFYGIMGVTERKLLLPSLD